MELLKEGLKKVKGSPNVLKPEESAYFSKLYQEWKHDDILLRDPTYKYIPQFYRPVQQDDCLPLKLREEAKSLFLLRKGQTLLDEEEIKTLCQLVEKQQGLPTGDDQLINYEDMQKVLAKSSPKCRSYLTATLFAKLQQGDIYNRVSIIVLFNYVMRKSWLTQSRIGLSVYDSDGKGYLKESDLENYILELIPTLPQLEGLEQSFHSFYVCTAVRKFIFFLDPLGTGKIRIQDILASSFLDDLLELQDVEVPKDSQEANWFSAPSALRIYGQYLNLDKNHNGMLSKDELAGLGTKSLTKSFLERVYQECLTYEGEMDYKAYLDFVLALENRHEPQSLQYIFKILDINKEGYLDTFALNFFFRDIQEQLKQNGQEPVSFQDVQDEMFDMIQPADPSKITLRDLLNSGHGDTLVSILIDLNGFWTHENREARAVAEDPSDV